MDYQQLFLGLNFKHKELVSDVNGIIQTLYRGLIKQAIESNDYVNEYINGYIKLLKCGKPNSKLSRLTRYEFAELVYFISGQCGRDIKELSKTHPFGSDIIMSTRYLWMKNSFPEIFGSAYYQGKHLKIKFKNIK